MRLSWSAYFSVCNFENYTSVTCTFLVCYTPAQEHATLELMRNNNQQLQHISVLLKKARHAAFATVNEDGSPHNSPLMLIYNDDLSKLYIGSRSDSLHVQNMLRTGMTYVTVFDSFVKGQGGIYITGRGVRECNDDELIEALKWHNKTRKKHGSEPIEIDFYSNPLPAQRMYAIDVTLVEYYSLERDKSGRIVFEARVPISARALCAQAQVV